MLGGKKSVKLCRSMYIGLLFVEFDTSSSVIFDLITDDIFIFVRLRQRLFTSTKPNADFGEAFSVAKVMLLALI